MTSKPAKAGEWVSHNQLVGSVSWGINRPKIFLRLCQVYRTLGLDIVDVESHVREGWFSKTIISRNTNEDGFDLNRLKRGVNKVSKELEFRSEIFSVPDSAQTSDREANVTIVIQAINKTGLLAEILEILDEFNIDIIDINILMDNEENKFALILQVFIPIEEEGFFSDLEKLRKQLHNFRRQPGLESFNYLVHSSETFNFIEKIDHETEV
jgi:predicted amino acid-binding ACT domain protein